MTTSDESALGVFEIQVSRKISGPLPIGIGENLNRSNDELYDICDCQVMWSG